MNLKIFAKIINKEKIKLKNGLTFYPKKGDILPAFLFALEYENESDPTLEKYGIHEKKLRKLHKFNKYEYSSSEIIIIYGDYKKYLPYLKKQTNNFYYNTKYNRLEIFNLTEKYETHKILQFLKTSEELQINITINNVTISHYSKILIKHFSYGILFTYLVMIQTDYITNDDIALISLLRNFPYKTQDVLINNIKKPLVKDLIKYYLDDKYWMGGIIVKLLKMDITPLLNYRLEEINNLYDNLIVYKPKPKTKIDEIINLNGFDLNLFIKRIDEQPINIKNAYQWLYNFKNNKVSLIILNKTSKLKEELLKLNNKNISNIYYDDFHIVLEVNEKFDKEILYKKIVREVMFYSVIDFKTRTLYLHKNEIGYGELTQADINYLAKLFNFNLKELLTGYLILSLNKKYHKLLLDNITSPFVKLIYDLGKPNELKNLIDFLNKYLDKNEIDLNQNVIETEYVYCNNGKDVLVETLSTQTYYKLDEYDFSKIIDLSKTKAQYNTYLLNYLPNQINNFGVTIMKWFGYVSYDFAKILSIIVSDFNEIKLSTIEFYQSDLYFEMIKLMLKEKSLRGGYDHYLSSFKKKLQYFDKSNRLKQLINRSYEEISKLYDNENR